MAIKVITHGDPNLIKSPKEYTRTCPECGCKMTYTWRDTIKSGWNGGYTTVICPDCGYQLAHLVAGGGDDINHPKIID